MAERKRFGYMDATDYFHELGEAAGATNIYASLIELLVYQPCAAECGVVKVEVCTVATEIAGDLTGGSNLNGEDIAEKNARYVAVTKQRIEHCEKAIEAMKTEVRRKETFVARLKAELVPLR